MKRNYDEPVYRDWRIKVYKRDKFTCQMPDCKSKYKLQAHHIRKWSDAAILRYDVDNGITLCRNCHDSINGLESHYEPLFSQIVRQKNGKL
jgi:5-methylcytosine-specific restriction endonuclease McrA